MQSKLTKMLHLQRQPVGIYFANTEARCDLDADPKKRNCVIPLLMKAAEGMTVSMDEESCNCAGGATGCCFGDGFARLNPSIAKLLSQGYGENAPAEMPAFMKEGERFFCTEAVAEKFREGLPYSRRAYPRIVFAPMSRWEEIGQPDLVYVFVNPDQLGALVSMLCSHNGEVNNTISPYCSACQSILFAAEQMEKTRPCAVMGLFDISQRYAPLGNLLSLTIPYCRWAELTQDLDKSCLTTHSWRTIEKRL
ncbi:MAG: DUF169 domain-containing protein [Oscillospiraceae bacterium]|nr:DUF169 domain-containing protein [Oscillospiraceae bacterium]